ncbi:nitroreductase/quinone reductase family protein [Thermocatellispora tengchongensis]|uniref:nitroreductase/quinone reductase family protein n=1 Tax=Thermocatellispora tengchongensis TaxID=1073253 RepID=UPI0036426488
MVYLADGPRLLIFASNAGRPAHPQWYVNLLADPKVRVEVGEEAYDAVAREITGPERDELYARQVARDPAFGAYQEATDRVIPVVALERAP